MNISAPFIQRPIATALLMVGLLAGGLIAYPLLPVASLPSVNYPTLTVTAQLPGADPQTMASTVAAPLELQFGEIPGLTQMTSASALGYVQITLQFELSRQIDGAVSDTLSAINAANAYLPTGLPYPPLIRKVNPADTPILVLGVSSDSLPLTVVDAYAQNILLQKLSQIPGVGLVGPHWLRTISAQAPHLRKAPPCDMQRSYSPVIVTISVFGILPPGIALLRT